MSPRESSRPSSAPAGSIGQTVLLSTLPVDPVCRGSRLAYDLIGKLQSGYRNASERAVRDRADADHPVLLRTGWRAASDLVDRNDVASASDRADHAKMANWSDKLPYEPLCSVPSRSR